MRINWRAAAGPLALLAGLCLLPVLAGAMLDSAEPPPLDPRVGLPQVGEVGASEPMGRDAKALARGEGRREGEGKRRGRVQAGA